MWDKCLSTSILTIIDDKCRCIRNYFCCHTWEKLDLSGNAPQFIRFAQSLI